MAGKTIDQTLKKKIIRYLKTHSQNATARHFKISPSTVNGIANADPAKKIVSEYSPPKNAILARKIYAKSDRIGVLHKLMGVIDRALDDPDLRPGSLSGVAIALGTTIDKFRLEEAEDTFEKDKGEINQMFGELRKQEANAKAPDR